MQIIKDQISFDDVLLIPQYSEVRSRTDVNTTSQLVTGMSMDIPIVSANMDTVTGTKMANAMWKMGAGAILTRHGFKHASDHASAIVSLNKRSFCVGVQEGDKDLLKELDKRGVMNEDTIITVDVAHAHSKHTIDMVKHIKDNYPARVIAGNIATGDAAQALVKAGADGVKVGIGPGSMCTTRVVTGCGFPQLSAVANVRSSLNTVKQAKHITIIADGGIRTSGDIVKALAAGADAVMVGSLLSGAQETPGEIYRNQRGHPYKIYRGQASHEAQKDNGKHNSDEIYAEGVYKEVPYSHRTAEDIVGELMRGVRSGMSYCGSDNLESLRKKARFVKVTSTTIEENGAHGL